MEGAWRTTTHTTLGRTGLAPGPWEVRRGQNSRWRRLAACVHGHDGDMRRRVSRVAIVAVAVALVLLAVPFAVGIRISFFADERTELERAALAAAVRVGPDFAAGDPVELPPPSTDGQVA